MKYLPLIMFLLFFEEQTLQSQTFFKGADLSYVKELEGCGVQWKENNSAKDILSIFKDNGANIARFRIWHTPSVGNNGFADTESMITRSKALGLNVMLDFHYSDTWADPGKQKCPAAWMAFVNNYQVLSDSIYNYTYKTLQTLKNNGLLPEFVQVGNETNGGMCFPGNGTVTWPTDWNKQTLLFNAGIKAVRDIDAKIKIILHVADPKNAEWWAGELKNNNVTDYDILGISFYPTYHTTKTISDFGTIVTNIRNTYSKDVMVVETGLPWTNAWDDNTTNIMNGVPFGYGANPSPEIQAQWLIDLSDEMVKKGGIGIVYWEPAWVASHISSCPAESGGSHWENIALFDFSNNLMNTGGIRFCQSPTNISQAGTNSENIPITVIPNYGNTELNVQFEYKSAETALFEIYDIQGKLLYTYTKKTIPGLNEFILSLSTPKVSAGIYVLHLKMNGVSVQQNFIISR